MNCAKQPREIYLWVLQRQEKLLNRITILLAQNDDRLHGVIHGLLMILEIWKDYFAQAARAAAIGAAAEILTAGVVTLLSWGLAAPFTFGAAAAAAAGVGGVVIDGTYGWNTYEQIGLKNMNRFSEYERMGKEKRRCLTEQNGEIQRQNQIMKST